MNNAKKVLIITSSAGSGHLQAAKAIEQDILSDSPNAKIVQKDLFLSFGFKKISKIFFHFFNKIPKNGLVPLHEKMVNLVFLSDKLLWPKFLFQIFFFLLKNDFDRIVDTQRVGTSALIKAIRLYNKFKKKSLYLEKVIVDLPTKRATNYFRYIKSLSKNDKKSIILYSLEPLLDDETTDEMFWQKYCKISKDQVVYKKYFIRNTFKNFQNKKIDENSIFIKIKTSNELERDLFKKIITVQNIDCLFEENVFAFSIKKQYFLMTILLGSLPSIAATKNYFTNFVLYVKNKKIEKTIFLFIYLSNENDLFNFIYESIKKDENFPKNLKIIPMSFQDDATIAPLFFRSNATITRSGGSTILELLAVANGKILIHSEGKLKQNLIKGIPYWEVGNALYLKKFKNSEIVNFENFIDQLEPLFSS